MSHTPGPWDWRKGELRTLHDRGEYQYGELVLWYDTADGLKCTDADMNLIAAAPELLAALKRIVKEIKSDTPGMWTQAEDAIRKAETGEDR